MVSRPLCGTASKPRQRKEFLARDNQLTQLMKRRPEYAANLAKDYGSEVRAAQKRKAKDAYNELLEGLFGAPLTILFASDGGNASALASLSPASRASRMSIRVRRSCPTSLLLMDCAW